VEDRALDELRVALELATNEELESLTEILFRRKFNPLDYVYTPDPIAILSQDRHTWLDAIETRFRFVAADGITVLQGRSRHITYRQILLQVCRYLKIAYSTSLSTEELEAEIFLHLLNRAWKQLPESEKTILSGQLQRVVSESHLAQQLPPAQQSDPVSLILKGGSALAVSTVVRPWILQVIARQFAIHAATYQIAQQTVAASGAAIATQLHSRVALQTASRGMAISAARYGAARSVFAVLGPAMWAYFFADLGWRAIATNYGRIIPVIFTLAQIRLTRSECFEMA
jgi:uncharacterized protein YaaW (UPF0174 family)